MDPHQQLAASQKLYANITTLTIPEIKTGNYTYTDQLLKLGANPNLKTSEKTALHFAIKKGFFSLIQLLLQYNPTDKGFIIALKKGNDYIIKLLLKKGNPTKDELHPAHIYAFATQPINPAAQVLINHFFMNYT